MLIRQIYLTIGDFWFDQGISLVLKNNTRVDEFWLGTANFLYKNYSDKFGDHLAGSKHQQILIVAQFIAGNSFIGGGTLMQRSVTVEKYNLLPFLGDPNTIKKRISRMWQVPILPIKDQDIIIKSVGIRIGINQ